MSASPQLLFLFIISCMRCASPSTPAFIHLHRGGKLAHTLASPCREGVSLLLHCGPPHTLVKAADTEARPARSAPPKGTAAMLSSSMGNTRQSRSSLPACRSWVMIRTVPISLLEIRMATAHPSPTHTLAHLLCGKISGDHARGNLGLWWQWSSLAIGNICRISKAHMPGTTDQ